MDKLFSKTPIGHQATAAKQRDNLGNTPLHYVENKLGELERKPDRNPIELRRLEYLSSALRTAAGKTGPPGEIDEIQNNVGRTAKDARAGLIASRIPEPHR